jgi:hypothetical protein
MKLLKAWRAVVRADNEKTADASAQVAAAVTAYHAALGEHELDVETSFSLYTVADSDGDGDAGDPTVLIRISDRYADWYVLVEGGAARVIAFYAYPYGAWCDDECFAYSEDEAGLLAKHVEAIPATREERDAWLVKALDGDRADRQARLRPIAKDDTQRYTLGVAYPHSELDSHGDFTDETELEQAAWNFMRVGDREGRGRRRHRPRGRHRRRAQVVESYIYRGPDWTIDVGDGETVVVKAGDWMVGAIWTEEAWPRIEKGELTGWSIQGMALIDSDATLEDAEA